MVKNFGTGGAVAKAASAIDCENFCHIWRLFLPITTENVQIFSINSQNLQFNGSFHSGQFDACVSQFEK